MKPIINNPCPASLKKIKTNNFYCKSCCKNIVDFRKNTNEELNAYFISNKSKNICGVFNENQVTVPKKSMVYNIKYFALVFLSFLGFHVSPIYSQNNDSLKKKNNSFEISKENQTVNNNTKNKPYKKVKKRKAFFRKNKKTRTVTGCPAF